MVYVKVMKTVFVTMKEHFTRHISKYLKQWKTILNVPNYKRCWKENYFPLETSSEPDIVENWPSGTLRCPRLDSVLCMSTT